MLVIVASLIYFTWQLCNNIISIDEDKLDSKRGLYGNAETNSHETRHHSRMLNHHLRCPNNIVAPNSIQIRMPLIEVDLLQRKAVVEVEVCQVRRAADGPSGSTAIPPAPADAGPAPFPGSHWKRPIDSRPVCGPGRSRPPTRTPRCSNLHGLSLDCKLFLFKG